MDASPTPPMAATFRPEVAGSALPAAAARTESFGAVAARRFLRHRPAVASLVVLLLIALAAALAPALSPHDPYALDPTAFGAPPSAAHPFGTDAVGRDVLSRLLYASRVSLLVGVSAVAINVVLGTLLGGIAGWAGGAVDAAIMRVTDMVLAFPLLMLILVLVSVLGPGLTNVVLVLGLLGWPQVARLVRAEVLRLKQQEFVTAARAIGCRGPRILFLHLLPNAFAPVLVTATFLTAQAIVIEASLSFLGMGVQPPTPSWGNLLTDAQSMAVLEQMPWLWAPAGALTVLAVLSINFVGDGLRDALDPRLKL
ncbi:oligopeptide ABC transporter permease [Carboxydochorda subterranea]|uniref:Oligopeptide ABC transporter permease n=1 Tax=Carboxydichorda subterranea TaxID=3109565 RepID=A0ABZ1BYC7_9FIRM|nr:oligopeptide ABC transporter permease [Limnochorda sp. L945t]WRP17598.1 oligopeptide ABC transporter permease [Limnochorda sp. L945t]